MILLLLLVQLVCLHTLKVRKYQIWNAISTHYATHPALGHGSAAQIPLLDAQAVQNVAHNDGIQPIEQSGIDPLSACLDGSIGLGGLEDAR